MANGPNQAIILTINGGSSSIKFAVFGSASPPRRIFSGNIERIGTPEAHLTTDAPATEVQTHSLKIDSTSSAAGAILDCIKQALGNFKIAGIGHRIVNGAGVLSDHQLITEKVIAELRRLQPLDLAHLPREIELIEAFAELKAPQFACFDTEFHRDLPAVARLLPIPRKYIDAGIRRLGFHGLSYTYLMGRLREIDPRAAQGRVILAHLGSGASMAAVHLGKPVDTTMAFTPTAGLVMATRPGDIDPGLLVYLMRDQNLSLDQVDEMISRQCGIIGVSETTTDMRDLIVRADTDPRAAEAFNLFCYQARKFIGAFAAALGGLDTLVFTAGIGQHSPGTRAAICNNLQHLGVSLEPARNTRGDDIISREDSLVTVRIIGTDEESVIAQIVESLRGQTPT